MKNKRIIALLMAMNIFVVGSFGACAGKISSNATAAESTLSTESVVDTNASAQSDAESFAHAEPAAETNASTESGTESSTSADSGTETAASAKSGTESSSDTSADRPGHLKYVAEEVPVPEGFEPFVRIDRDDPEAYKDELDNLRLITEGRYEFIVPDEKYGVPDMEPDTTGMDTLNISGSAEFSEEQFYKLADTLRECAGGKEIYIVDLRRESHAMLNSVSYEWYDSYNWSNFGLTVEEIEKDQDERFGSMVGGTMKAYPKKDNLPQGEGIEVQVESYLTEKELVENAGFHSVRIPVLDHSFPSAGEVDAFVEFVNSIDMDNSWLHFHCQGGTGRTIIFMMMYDKMKNPDVPMEDIMIRQTKLGGIYPLYITEEEEFKKKIYEDRAELSQLFFRYVDENREDGYQVKWSDWLKENRE